MKFQKRRGVSVIVATLLLIAISVSAAIVVYVFVGGLAGQLTQNGGGQVKEQLSLQSYTFAINPGTCGCADSLLEIFLINNGPATTTISALYVNGALVTKLTSIPISTSTQALSGCPCWIGMTAQSTLGGTSSAFYFNNTPSPSTQYTYSPTNTGQVVVGLSSAATYGAGYTIKIISSTGATNVFSAIAGETG